MLLDGRGSSGTPPVDWPPSFSAKETAIRLLADSRLAWRSQSGQLGGGPGQPALHTPGLPANNYSGGKPAASGLSYYGQV